MVADTQFQTLFKRLGPNARHAVTHPPDWSQPHHRTIPVLSEKAGSCHGTTPRCHALHLSISVISSKSPGTIVQTLAFA